MYRCRIAARFVMFASYNILHLILWPIEILDDYPYDLFILDISINYKYDYARPPDIILYEVYNIINVIDGVVNSSGFYTMSVNHFIEFLDIL